MGHKVPAPETPPVPMETNATGCFTTVESPLGELLLTSDGRHLTGLYTPGHKHPPDTSKLKRDDAFFTGVRDQLQAYFAGKLRAFDVPVRAAGTDFQHRVWAALTEVPFAETVTYGELAERLGKVDACRAVGLANGRNPVSIIVPCHRVVGASGALTGYAGGLEAKAWLLEHEKKVGARRSGIWNLSAVAPGPQAAVDAQHAA
jgi:methylated-DNA-[protein]-cysteine S-methyltransferase